MWILLLTAPHLSAEISSIRQASDYGRWYILNILILYSKHHTNFKV